MSNTHDHDIANQIGSNFRSDINNVLGDIQTSNSGANEPTTKVAYKLWIDTANNRVKIRNGANNAWIDLGSTTPEMGHATSANPSLTGTVNSAGDIVCNSNERIKLPVGTTGQRPSSPSSGDVRFNATLSTQETYNGTDWVASSVPSGGSSNNVLKNDGSGGLSWTTVATLLGFPSQSGQSGKYLGTNGSVLSWLELASSSHQQFNSSGTWNKPSQGSLVIMFAWGAGGGGGVTYLDSRGGGGGGGGCAFYAAPLSSLASSYSVNVGTGGTGGQATYYGSGTGGGNTSVGSLFTAYGGAPGTCTNSTDEAAGSGGGFWGHGPTNLAGGAAARSAIYGDDSQAGWSYYSGSASYFGGGGGGIFDNSLSKNGANSFFGGGGGGGKFGSGGNSVAGGNGGNGGDVASNGSTPGGGGGGGSGTHSGGGSARAGNGANGRVDIYVI